MFTSRRGVGLSTRQIKSDDPTCSPSQQLQFSYHTRPPVASLSASFESFFQNLPWNQVQRAVPQRTGAGAQTEPKTNTRFEERFCQRGNSKCGDLAGVG